MTYQPIPGGASLKFPHSKVVRMFAKSVEVTDITETFAISSLRDAYLQQIDFEPEMVVSIKYFRGSPADFMQQVREVATGKIGLHIGSGAATLTVLLEKASDSVLIKMFLT